MDLTSKNLTSKFILSREREKKTGKNSEIVESVKKDW